MADCQLEFSFMEELREQEKKRTEDRVLPYFPHPRDDNQRLLNYQHDWLANGDTGAWSNLWGLAQKVARRMIRAMGKRRGFTLTKLDEDDRVESAVCYVLRRYQDGWYVKKAYLKAIKEGVIHALWYRTLADEVQDSVPEEQMALIKHHDPDPLTDERPLVLVEGKTRAEVEAKIRGTFLPEIADMLIDSVGIIGGEIGG